MTPEPARQFSAPANLFTATDVAEVLREHGWLRGDNDAVAEWMREAALLLGPQAANRAALAGLITLIFEFDAHTVIASRECQEVLGRDGAREVLRVLAIEILSGGPVDSSRLKEIVTALKAKLTYSSREIFLLLRVALTGHVGDGALDRVVLLLDRAAQIKELAPVKSVRTRILEFCIALD